MIKHIREIYRKSPPRVWANMGKLYIKGAPGGYTITKVDDDSYESVYGAYGASKKKVFSAEKVAHLIWERKCKNASIAALLKLGWLDILRLYKDILTHEKS